MAVSSQRQRLIIVEVKQKKGEGYFRLTLPEPVARKVLCWHIKLEIALEDANPDERLVIQDHTRRNEEVLLRVVEFLLDGHLPQLHYAEPDTYLLTLKKLVRMHDLAEKIELYALQRAICQKIEREPLMSLGLLLDYAAYVYRTVKGEPKHSPSSKLGQSIKTAGKLPPGIKAERARFGEPRSRRNCQGSATRGHAGELGGKGRRWLVKRHASQDRGGIGHIGMNRSPGEVMRLVRYQNDCRSGGSAKELLSRMECQSSGRDCLSAFAGPFSKQWPSSRYSS